MSVLEMRHVSRTYGQGADEVHALTDVDLAVEAGSMVAVMGPSGSGKSTLLTIAGSLEEPSIGDVLIGGAQVAKMSRNAKARLRRRSIGYVFQDFNLLPGLTAAENVALPLELDGVSARKARLAGLAALDELGLGAKAGKFPDQLSGGERQRVAIARAVVGDRRRSRALPLRDILASSCPATTTSPLVGSSRLPAMVSRVDLPEPLGPMTATMVPASTDRLMLASAWTSAAPWP